MRTPLEDSEDESEMEVPLEEEPFAARRARISPPPPSSRANSSAAGSPRGGSRPNLRGPFQFRPEPRSGGSRPEVIYVQSKVDVKDIKLKELPTTYLAYPIWRWRLKNKVRARGPPGSFTTPFIARMDSKTLEDLKAGYLSMNDVEYDVEAKLFSAVVDACTETKHRRHLTAIKDEANDGAGREAVKILDRLFLFTKANEMLDASDIFLEASCSSIAGLGDYIVELRGALQAMRDGGQPIHDYLLLSRIKRVLKPFDENPIVPEVKARYAEFEARPEERRSVEELLNLMQLCYDEWSKGQERKAKSRPSAKTVQQQPGGVRTPCTGCGSTRHREANCWTLHPELRPSPSGPSGGGGGGGGTRQQPDRRKKEEERKAKEEKERRKKDKKDRRQAAAARKKEETAKKEEGGRPQGTAAQPNTSAAGKGNEGKHPKCPHCGRTNHAAAECLFARDSAGNPIARVARERTKTHAKCLLAFLNAAGTGAVAPAVSSSSSGSGAPSAPSSPERPSCKICLLRGADNAAPRPLPSFNVEKACAAVENSGEKAVVRIVAGSPTSWAEAIEEADALLKDLGLRAKGLAAWCLVSGASTHIVDSQEKEEIQALQEREKSVTMDIVGGELEIRHDARVLLPFGTAPVSALATAGTPCCAAMIPWAKHEGAMVVVNPDDGSVKSYKKDKRGRFALPYVSFDVINEVPHFPRARGALAKELCEEGYLAQVRRLEEMGAEEFRQKYSQFKAFRDAFDDWCEAHPESARALEDAKDLGDAVRVAAEELGFAAKDVSMTEDDDASPAADAGGSPEGPPGGSQRGPGEPPRSPKGAPSSSGHCPVENGCPPGRDLSPRSTRGGVIGAPRRLPESAAAVSPSTPGVKRPRRREPRKRRRAEKLRLERAVKKEEELDPSHFVAHWPPSDACRWCVEAKQRRADGHKASPEEAEERRMPRPRMREHYDLGTCRHLDVHHRRYFAVGRDDYSEYKHVGLQKSKTPEETWKVAMELYPGSALVPAEQDPEAEFPLEWSIDPGPEFDGPFKTGSLERGGRRRLGAPGRKKDVAKGEKAVGDVERDTAVAMHCANAGVELWGYGAEMTVHNVNCTRKVRDTGKTAHLLYKGREYEYPLFPFACACAYVVEEDERDKMQKRTREGALIGYFGGGVMKVLDVERWSRGVFSVITTKDFEANRADFPLRRLDKADLKDLKFHFDADVVVQVWLDDDGVKRCSVCSRVHPTQQVTCEACVKGSKHKRGHPKSDCRLSQCKGHQPRQTEEECCEEEELEQELRAEKAAEGELTPRRRIAPHVGERPATPEDVAQADLRKASYDARQRAASPFDATTRTAEPAPPPGEAGGASDFPPSPVGGILPGIGPQLGIAKQLCAGIRSTEAMEHVRTREARRKAARIQATNESRALDDVRRIGRFLGLVTRLVPSGSREILDSPAALSSIDDEYAQLEELGVINPRIILSWPSVRRENPLSRIVSGMMLTSIKGEELGAAMRRWKSRFVALGNNLRNAQGEKVEEALRHYVPVSLTGVRLAVGWELICALEPGGSITLRGDVKGAYLTSRLSGPPTFLRLRGLRNLPERWAKHIGSAVDPCMRMDRSCYGLERGDTDWGARARTIVTEVGCLPLEDVGEESMWRKPSAKGGRPCFVVLYSDDFIVSGPANEAVLLFRVLRERLGFSTPGSFVMTEIIGLERYNFLEGGCKAAVIHQAAYARYVVQQFQDRHWKGRPLRKAHTPGFARELKGAQNADGLAEEDFDVPVWIPDLGREASEWGGKLLWLARGSRPDLSTATRKLMERVQQWTRMEDYLLFRVLSYLSTYVLLGIKLVADPDENPGLLVNLRTDADNAGDTCHSRSVTGFHTTLRGARRTKMLMDWGSRRQRASGRHTADTETAACDEGTFSSGLPMQGVMEQMMERPVRLYAEQDNDASIAAIHKGYSRRLCYLRRTQRISLGALHEVYCGREREELVVEDTETINRLKHRPSAVNSADVFTKLLEEDAHWRHMTELGMVPVDPSWVRSR